MGMVTGLKSVWHRSEVELKLSFKHREAVCAVQRKWDLTNLFIISFSFFGLRSYTILLKKPKKLKHFQLYLLAWHTHGYLSSYLLI